MANSIYEKLAKIQVELEVKKSRYNRFGEFNYRSKEDILEAVKPYLKEYGLLVVMSDKIKTEPTGRTYIVSTVALIEVDTGDQIQCESTAREPESKKKMDDSQVTGMAASYAGKRALGNLFAIDDTKDADEVTEAPESASKPAEVRCTTCGKKYHAKDLEKALAWLDGGAEQCCEAPSWKLFA